MDDNDRSQGEVEGWLTSQHDEGRAHFGEHGEVSKYDQRLIAFGECAEANAAIGVAVAQGSFSVETTALLSSVQNDMLDLAADLSVPRNSDQQPMARITEGHLQRLDRAVEQLAQEIPDPEAIILPGGTVGAALLYQARTLIRRAERAVWRVTDENPDHINPLAGQFLDRLSALMLVLARTENDEHGHMYWEPGASAHAMTGDDDGADPPSASTEGSAT